MSEAKTTEPVPESSAPSPILCSCKKDAEAYCFAPGCKSYACAECEKRHAGHQCLKLKELVERVQELAGAELARADRVIGAQNEHIRGIKDGEDDLRQIVNNQKQAIVNMLWEIYRLINDCLFADIDSHTFFLNQLAEKRRDVEARQQKIVDLRSVLKAAKEGARSLKNPEDCVTIYSAILDKRVPETVETQLRKDIEETALRTSKYKYDQLNNKFMGLTATFIENLRKRKGGLEDLDDKYRRPDAFKVARFKDVRKDYKEKLVPHVSPYSYCLKESTNELLVYNAKVSQSLRIKIGDWKPLRYMDSAQVGTTIYFSGGGAFEKFTYAYDYILNGNSVERKCDMNFGKKLHKLLPITKYRLMSICGDGPDGPLDVCEIFDIPENVWKFGPATNERKYAIAPVCFSSRFVYIFGGYTIRDGVDRFLSTVEMLDTKTSPQQWKMVQVPAGQGPKPCMDMAAVQISRTQILLFGGYDGTFKTSAWLFAPQSGSLVPTGDMCAGESFNARKPVIFAEQVCVIGYHHKNVHTYDVKTGEWKMVEAEKWIPRVPNNNHVKCVEKP